ANRKKKRKTIDSNKKSGLDKSRIKAKHSKAANDPEDDSMVAQGGPAIDDDTEEAIERPKKGKRAKGAPTAPLVDIHPVAPKPLTRKEARGGALKWGVRHLPAGTADEFANEVVPLAIELAGTVSPWEGLTIKQIQDIVDKVYSKGKYKVEKDSVWVGLIGYRLSDWRSGLGLQGIRAMEMLIKLMTSDDSEEEEEDINSGADAEFPDDLILYTFAYHLTKVATIPAEYKHLDDFPIGALLLSSQAVQRALQFWQTGELIVPPRAPGYFSVENWGDTRAPLEKEDPQFTGLLVRRATKHLASVQKWDKERWDQVKAMAARWVELPSRKRVVLSSRSASEASDGLMMPDDVIVVSD
ncbi:hypothetical protein C8R43DRAFT_893712, partial [Mycena crocata]